jgi:hypothetical protein
MNTYRNGDWTITPTKESITNPIKHNGSFVFAEGEATGHFHTIVVERPEDLSIEKTATGDYIFVLTSKARVTHPEHSMKVDLEIPPGTYRLNQRREKDWFQMVTRKVID